MYLNCVGALIFVAFISLFRIDVANAQAIPKSIQQGGSDAAIRERKNAWTVGIAGGLIDGTYMRFADELGKVLDDGDNLRILPMVSYGAASNLDDLLYLRGVDLAVTQSDVFEYFRTKRKTPNLQNRVQYMLRLPIAELHILAKTDIRSVEDLRGKRVNFGPSGKWLQSNRRLRALEATKKIWLAYIRGSSDVLVHRRDWSPVACGGKVADNPGLVAAR
jgi:TRAP-type uncharacterized transport system substrate-binding protein